MRSYRSIVAVVATLLLVPAGVAGASGHVEVVLALNPAAGEFPEGVAVDKIGNVYFSVSPLGQVRKLATDGTISIHASVVPPGSGLGTVGLAVDAPGNVYVAVATFDPANRGIYRIASDGTSVRLPGTGAIILPNGLTLDKRGNIYVTDSILGAVWRIPRGGTAELWFSSPLLVGDGSFGLGFPIGANGIAYRQGGLVVTNSEAARLVRIPIEPDGSPGSATVLAEDAALYGADGIAFDVHGDVWVAVIIQSTIVRVSPSGAITTVATAADGLDFASSIAFGTGKGERQSLYAVNFAIGPPGGAGPALLKLAAGVPGQPVP